MIPLKFKIDIGDDFIMQFSVKPVRPADSF